MKFLELTGYGNKIKHFVNIKAISDITFESTHTNISFISGKALNVVESKEEIEKMIYYLEGIIINKDTADYEMHNDFWDVTPYDDQDLPF
jgi:uncharacterized protein YlzI (FlbEa/FlbD family)